MIADDEVTCMGGGSNARSKPLYPYVPLSRHPISTPIDNPIRTQMRVLDAAQRPYIAIVT